MLHLKEYESAQESKWYQVDETELNQFEKVYNHSFFNKEESSSLEKWTESLKKKYKFDTTLYYKGPSIPFLQKPNKSINDEEIYGINILVEATSTFLQPLYVDINIYLYKYTDDYYSIIFDWKKDTIFICDEFEGLNECLVQEIEQMIIELKI